MPQIGRSVGKDGQNDFSDVALVQVMLRIARNSRGKAFFPFAPSGHADESTRTAIKEFQNAHGLASVPGASAARAIGSIKVKNPAGVLAQRLMQNVINGVGNVATLVAPADKLGLVEPNSFTFQTLVQEVVKVNSDFAGLRVLPGTTMAYLEASSQDLDDCIKEIRNSRRRGRNGPVGPAGSGLEPGFRDLVIEHIKKMYDKHKIVLKAWEDFNFGRDFDGQLSRVETGSSQAGPGEGNHNFGRAMDIGYRDLQWIMDDGRIATIKDETAFDHDKNLGNRRREWLNAARNALLESPPIGAGKLFRIRMGGGDNDPNHFQAYSQFPHLYPSAKVLNIRQSLVGLLNLVGPKFALGDLQRAGLKVTAAMQWQLGNHYECDLGFGGAFVSVGTATEIFKGNAQVSAHAIAKLTNTAAAPGAPHVSDHAISHAQVNAMKKALKQIFDLADEHWLDWKALDNHGNPI